MKREVKRILSSILCAVICVSLNLNPLAVICGAIADSGFVDGLGNIKDHLIYYASEGVNRVFAEEPNQSGALLTGDNSVINLDANVVDYLARDYSIELFNEPSEPDIGPPIEEITRKKLLDELTGDKDKDLTDIYLEIEKINGSLGYEDSPSTLSADMGRVNETLASLDIRISAVLSEIQKSNHEYRVAHLYSLNNTFDNALWKPYSEDIPYVSDFATVTGGFANVYTGFWDSGVTTVLNPGNSKTSRYYEVLGYDAIVRRQGIILLADTKKVKDSAGPTGQSWVVDASPTAAVALYQEYIPEEAVTWLDAVTLLYKALGQEQYSYQSFMSADYSITPETSPAYQNLSNIVPTQEANGTTHYNGYNFYMFLSRDNVFYGDIEGKTQKVDDVYWKKAVNGGFVNDADMDRKILSSEFWVLAYNMMQAYGEPEMNLDEVKALLQVYGSDYPVQLGIEIADAWAYLKVRGCLNIDNVPSDYMSREDLLNVCMCIKDPDSRSDYKTINVVLDLADVMREDGYYPVYDMRTTSDQFSSSKSYNYGEANYYDYLLYKSSEVTLGGVGIPKVFKEKKIADDGSTLLDGAEASARTVNIDGKEWYHISVPKSYSGNIYIAMAAFKGEDKNGVAGTVDWIEIPSNMLGGGFYTKYNVDSKTKTATVSTDDGRKEFDIRLNDETVLPYVDYKRSGDVDSNGNFKAPGKSSAKVNSNTGVVYASNASNATVLEKLSYYIDEWTSPMTVSAAPNTGTGGANGEVNIVFKSFPDIAVEDVNKVDDSNYEFNVKGAPADSAMLTVKTNYTIPGSSSPSKAPSGLVDYRLESFSGAPRLLAQLTIETAIPGTLNEMFVKMNWNWSSVYGGMVTYNQANANAGFWGNGSHKLTVTGLSDGFSNTNKQEQIDFYRTNVPAMLYYGTVLRDSVKATQSGGSNYEYHVEKVTNDSAYKNLPDDKVQKLNTEFKSLAKALDEFHAEVTATTNKSFTIKTDKVDEFLSFLGDNTYGDGATSGGTDEPIMTETIASSVIMNRTEQILVSWTDLVNCGFVLPQANGGQPSPDAKGNYTFFTKDGQVRVNDINKTIQIGTTLYDLAYTSGVQSPTLVYIDNDQNGALYFDARCVMGQIQAKIDRNGTTYEIGEDKYGSGRYVVYDFGANGAQNDKLFTYKDVRSWSLSAKELDSSAAFSVRTIATLPMIDNQPMGNDTSTADVYWPTGRDNYYSRFGLASFYPTANWITIIDDDGAMGTEPTAHLYVYYPKQLFYEKDNDLKTSLENAPDGLKTYETCHDSSFISAGAGGSIANVVDDIYSGEPDDWTVQMSKHAIQHLFALTGKYYCSPNWRVREFDISTSSVVSPTSDWQAKSNGEPVDINGNKFTSNSPGAIYWVQSVGYVYNMPTSEKFDWDKYALGQIPLPICTSALSGNWDWEIINYNFDYYGKRIDKNGSDGDDVPYGYYLAPEGFKDKSGTVQIPRDQLSYGDVNGKPPFKINEDGDTDQHTYHQAPTAIYFYFGNNDIASNNSNLSGITQYNTEQNYFFFGGFRLKLTNSETDSSKKTFSYTNEKYGYITLDPSVTTHIVMKRPSYSINIIHDASIRSASTSSTGQIIVDNYETSIPKNPLEGWIGSDLLELIDDGSSWLIAFAFYVMPLIGIILMMILAGLSFVGDNRAIHALFKKTIDPVRILTFGHMDITRWHWRRVLIPVTLLFTAFALVLRGNLIRIIMWGAEWYGVVSQWFKNAF